MQLTIALAWDGFDYDPDPGVLVLRDADRVFAFMFRRAQCFILVELRLVTLLLQNHGKCGLTKRRTLKIEQSILGARHLELKRVPFTVNRPLLTLGSRVRRFIIWLA